MKRFWQACSLGLLILLPLSNKKQKLEEANQRPKAKVVKVLTEQK